MEDLGWSMQLHHEFHSFVHIMLNWYVMRWQFTVLQKQTQLLHSGIILLQADAIYYCYHVIHHLLDNWDLEIFSHP